jgi:hypothetical protein
MSPHFFECDFQNPLNSDHVSFSICEIEKANYHEEILFSNKTMISDLNYDRTTKKEYTFTAAKVKLVKQRPILTANSWTSNAKSTRLIKKHSQYLNGKIVTTYNYNNIKYASNEITWREFENNKIPACMSFNFDSKYDNHYGLLYNKFCFSDGILDVSNVRALELFEISNSKYQIKGDDLDFWNFLVDDLNLKNTATSRIDTKTHHQVFFNFDSYDRLDKSSDNFLVNNFRNNWSKDVQPTICYFYINSYSKKLQIHFESEGYGMDSFEGISIRYVKK